MYPQSRTIRLGEFSVRIDWEYDYDSSPEQWLGKTKDEIGPYCIDRKYGRLLGEYKHGYLDIPIPEGLTDWKKGDHVYSDDFNLVDDAAWDAVLAHLGVIGLWDESDTDTEVGFDMPEDEEDHLIRVYYGGYEILRNNLGTPWERHQYRYFYPEAGHLPHKQENWGHVPLDVIEKVQTEFGSIEDTDIEYAVQDWNRFEDFYRGDWSFLGCSVEVYSQGISIGYSGLWGIESDSDERYLREVERDLVATALDSAHEHCVDLAEAAKAVYELDETRIDALLEELQSEAETD